MMFFHREFKATNTAADIGIKPAAGIQPRKLKLDEIKPDPRSKCLTQFGQLHLIYEKGIKWRKN